jgi:hypothetical protein
LPIINTFNDRATTRSTASSATAAPRICDACCAEKAPRHARHVHTDSMTAIISQRIVLFLICRLLFS